MSTSDFQKYWERLQTERPEAYQDKLKRNRERIRKMRQDIYADPEKHAAWKKARREQYAARKQKAVKS